MWGPDKYQEETPELMAAIDELRSRVDKLKFGRAVSIGDGIIIVVTYKVENDLFRIPDGFYVEVHARRAYTLSGGDSAYADPDLIINKVLPALRQHQVLDDIVDATKEPPGEAT